MICLQEIGDVLDRLCPIHMLLDSTGHVTRVGPTLQKLRPDRPFPGCRFLEVFELLRPRGVDGLQSLLAAENGRLRLRFRDEPRTAMKGVVLPAPDGAGAIIGLSFGISVQEAVRDYALTGADFADTDLAIELLYLVEAKSAAMEASRSLNQRLQVARIAAEEQAFTDTLTGLKNRRALDHILARKARRGSAFALMHLDLDHFKAVNDTLGHAAGDHVLQHAARLMIDETREDDVVARIGGDEFVLILDRLSDRAQVQRLAERLIARLEEPVQHGDQLCRISASAGTVLCTRGAEAESAQLLHQADLALYAAKKAGRGCHRFYEADRHGTGKPLPNPARDASGPNRH